MFNLSYFKSRFLYLVIIICIFCNHYSLGLGEAKVKNSDLSSLRTNDEAQLPKLYDTLRILKHPQGQREALTYLDALSLSTLKTMKGEQLFQGLEKLICIKSQTKLTAPKLYNILKAIKIISRLGEIRPCMAQTWLKVRDKRELNINGSSPNDVITRAVALAARQTHRVDLLQGLALHPDPEVRVHVAYAAAEPKQLCNLLNDRWPMVQRAAMIGIEKIAAPSGLCLIDQIPSLNAQLRERGIRALGRLGQSNWAQDEPKRNLVLNLLSKLLNQRQNSIHLRNTVLVALANWGYLSDSRDILKEHLASGHLEGLVLGALQAMTVAQPTDLMSLFQSLFEKTSSLRIRRQILKHLSRYPQINNHIDHTPPQFDQNRATQVLDYLKQILSHKTVKLDQTNPLFHETLKTYQELNQRLQSHKLNNSPSMPTSISQEDEPFMDDDH